MGRNKEPREPRQISPEISGCITNLLLFIALLGAVFLLASK